MNNPSAITLALVLGAGGAAAGYWYATRHADHAPASQAAAQGAAATQAERKVLFWYDPMYPATKFDKPGKSPFMDMQLVPKYADEAADAGGGVSIDPRIVQNLGVRTVAAEQGTLERRVEAVGSVAWNERGVVVLQARTAGFVEKLHARAPLDPVAKGAPLVELLVPEWTGAQEEYLALLRSKIAGGDELRAAARARLLLLGMNERDVQRLEASGMPQSRITLHSPIDGVIAELDVREGMTVMAGATLFRIVNLGTVWVNAQVPETLGAVLRPGAPVEARVAAYPGDVFKGKVGAILPEVDAATRSIRARIELANPGAKLKPGMFATLDFRPDAARPALLVPSEAVIRTGERNVVVVADGEGRFRPVEVQIGADSGGRTEVVSGIAAGTRVVVSGQFLIDSEASLRASGTRMQGGADVHRASGVLEHIAKDALTISHAPVPALKWPEMTMEFVPPKDGVPPDLKPGDRIMFEFRAGAKDGDWEVTRLDRATGGQAAAGTVKPAPPPAAHDHGSSK
jgi:Cu(I)/Ag(I) efflux system membrane fusion protein